MSQRQQKTRLALMTAFLHLVTEHGLDQISVTDIANAADYGRWTFYQYFESKEDVAWETFVYWMTQLDQHILASVAHLPSPSREYESWRLIFQAFQQQRTFFLRLESLLISKWYVRAKEYLIYQFSAHLNAGHFVLMEGVRPEIAARLYVTALMAMLEHWARNPHLGDAEAMVDEFYAFIYNQTPLKTSPR